MDTRKAKTVAPFGPCIVTTDEIADPQPLDLWLTVNGQEKQSSNTRYMPFKVDTLISDISAAITLEAGDVIATGTPEGVNAGRNPREWLWPGDVVEAEVTGIEQIRHPVVAISATHEPTCMAGVVISRHPRRLQLRRPW